MYKVLYWVYVQFHNTVKNWFTPICVRSSIRYKVVSALKERKIKGASG